MTDSTFAALGLSADTLDAITAAGYDTPTAIQVHGVPALQTGKDVILQAQTGTGKTAAFVLPTVDKLSPNPGTVEVLVLVPTRELANQVAGEFERFGGSRGIHAAAIYGGTSFQKQYDALDVSQVVVATPGRLLDLKRRKKIRLDKVKVFGLDESDEMLSMGFERDVLDVAAMLPEVRQSFLCSATYSDDIKRVANNFISDPLIVNVSSDQIGAQSVRHEYYAVPMAAKLDALRRLIDTHASEGAIIFANTRAATFRVHETLLAEDVSVDVLNGDLSQAEREKALARMRADEIRFLVATDVAARGIDISGLPSVINFDMPESPDVYIHRTGRTGRAGQAGVAYSFVTPADITTFHALQKFYGLELHEERLPSRTSVMNVKADRALDTVLDSLDADASLPYAIHLPLARRLAEREDGARVIAKLIAHFDVAGPGATTTLSDLSGYARPSTVSEAQGNAAASAANVEAMDEDEARAHRRPSRGGRPAPEPRREEPRREEPRREEPRREEARGEEARGEEAEAPKAGAPKAAAAAPGDLAQAIYDWLAAQPPRRARGRWRTVDAIAEGIDASIEAVETSLAADERMEESRNKPGQWRILRDALPDDPSAPEPKREAKRERPNREERPSQDRAPRRERDDRSARAERPEPPSRPKAAKSPFATSGKMVDVKLNVGEESIDDVLAFATALVEIAGLDLEDLGGVSPKPKQSVVHVLEDYALALSDAINGATWNGLVLKASRPGGRRGRR